MVWWVVIGCGPRIPIGAAPLEARPVPVHASPGDGASAVFTVRVDGGSAADPPGREGLAWVTADVVFRPLAAADRTSAWWVRPDGTELTLICPVSAAGECARALGDALVAPRPEPDALAAARAAAAGALSLEALPDDRLGPVALDLLVHRSRPTGHLAAGRTSVLPTLRPDEVLGFHRAWFTRGHLAVEVAGLPEADTRALATALASLPSPADPLRPMGGAAPPLQGLGPGTWVIGRPTSAPAARVWIAWTATAPEDGRTAVDDELVSAGLVDEVTPVGDGRLRLVTTPDRLGVLLATLPALPPAVVVAITDELTAEALASGPTRVPALSVPALVR